MNSQLPADNQALLKAISEATQVEWIITQVNMNSQLPADNQALLKAISEVTQVEWIISYNTSKHELSAA